VRFGISVPNFCPAEMAPPVGSSHLERIVEWARAAEAAGWDGFFIWDHLLFWKDWRLLVEDPWVLLTAIATATRRMRIGPMVTPLPRRRPWKLARECVSLDHLSQGRLTLGVGLGAPAEADSLPFGESGDNRKLAETLDEGLAVLAGLWSGEPFSFRGQHFQVEDVTFLPGPLQQPRIPIWVAGTWPKRAPMRRAARWDGAFPLKLAPNGQFTSMTAEDVRQVREYISQQRESLDGFHLVVGGNTPAGDRTRAAEILAPFAEAGLTWWVEGLDWFGYKDPAAIAERISEGPPSLR
jgi:alkanesulfonate monooxygenase SsuD/methylene tetrahydromethanopterin reductase-like flavin-dependent oxidoreductase (luciferase family)